MNGHQISQPSLPSVAVILSVPLKGLLSSLHCFYIPFLFLLSLYSFHCYIVEGEGKKEIGGGGNESGEVGKLSGWGW